MRRPGLLPLLLVALLVHAGGTQARSENAPMRGVLVNPARVTPDFLAGWKAKGVSEVVVPLDESTRPGWGPLAKTVAGAGMHLWPWIEVARNPEMARVHPEWLAAVGGHTTTGDAGSRTRPWRRRVK